MTQILVVGKSLVHCQQSQPDLLAPVEFSDLEF